MAPTKHLFAVIGMPLCCIASSALGTQAPRTPALGPEASAVAGAYGGLAQDPSAVRFNPAGVVFAPKLWSTASEQGYAETTIAIPDSASSARLDATLMDTPTYVGFTLRDPARVGDWAVAAALYEDGAISYKNDFDLTGDISMKSINLDGHYKTAFRSRGVSSNQHAAVAVAHAAGARIALGAAFEVARVRVSSQDLSNVEITYAGQAEGSQVVSHQLNQSDVDAEGRFAGLGAGVMALFDDGLRAGVSIRGGRYVWQRGNERSTDASGNLTPDGQVSSVDPFGNKTPGEVRFDRAETTDAEPFDAPPPEARLSVARVAPDGARWSGDLIFSGYARNDSDRLHPIMDIAIGGGMPLAEAWRLDGGVATAFDAKRAQSVRGFGDAADYSDLYLITSGLTFVSDDFRVTGLVGVGYGQGYSPYYAGDGTTEEVKVSQRRWQVGIAFVNWK